MLELEMPMVLKCLIYLNYKQHSLSLLVTQLLSKIQHLITQTTEDT